MWWALRRSWESRPCGSGCGEKWRALPPVDDRSRSFVRHKFGGQGVPKHKRTNNIQAKPARAQQDATDGWRSLDLSIRQRKQETHHDGRWDNCRDCAFNWDLVGLIDAVRRRRRWPKAVARKAIVARIKGNDLGTPAVWGRGQRPAILVERSEEQGIDETDRAAKEAPAQLVSSPLAG